MLLQIRDRRKYRAWEKQHRPGQLPHKMAPDTADEVAVPLDLSDECLLGYLQMSQATVVISKLRGKDPEGKFGALPQASLLWCLAFPIAKKFPPGRPYRERLLKLAMLAAEKDGEEISDALAEAHIASVTESAATRLEDDQWCHNHKTFILDCPRDCREANADGSTSRSGDETQTTSHKNPATNAIQITIKTHPNLFEGGTGCHEWASGFKLAELVASHPRVFAGKVIAEIGSGVGVTAIALAQLGLPKMMHLLDRDSETMGNCTSNLAINGIVVEGFAAAIAPGALDARVSGNENENEKDTQRTKPPVRLTCLDWFDVNEQALFALNPDLVLAADVLYDPLDVPGVLDATKALLGFRGAADGGETNETKRTSEKFIVENEKCAIFVSALRQPKTMELFVQTAKNRGFEPLDITETFCVKQGVGFRRLGNVQRTNIIVHALRPPVG